MNPITFWLPITPPRSTSQGKRVMVIAGRPMFFKKKEHQSAENDLLLLCAPHKPAQQLDGPVRLEIEFTFPWRKSEKKSNLRFPRIPHTTKPDCDNMAKLIGDVLTKLQFYGDDSQVSCLVISKFWGHKVGIGICLSPINISTIESNK
jgi:Holliday junction resolvase RusA-like endonuclease